MASHGACSTSSASNTAVRSAEATTPTPPTATKASARAASLHMHVIHSNSVSTSTRCSLAQAVTRCSAEAVAATEAASHQPLTHSRREARTPCMTC